jgi:hypothetical protein
MSLTIWNSWVLGRLHGIDGTEYAASPRLLPSKCWTSFGTLRVNANFSELERASTSTPTQLAVGSAKIRSLVQREAVDVVKRTFHPERFAAETPTLCRPNRTATHGVTVSYAAAQPMLIRRPPRTRACSRQTKAPEC